MVESVLLFYPEFYEVWLIILCAAFIVHMILLSYYVRYDSKLVNDVRFIIESDSFSRCTISLSTAVVLKYMRNMPVVLRTNSMLLRFEYIWLHIVQYFYNKYHYVRIPL